MISNNNEEPLVTILCITYNHAPYIRETINSFLEQKTNFSYEILIHDDHSTDGTEQILQDIASKNPNVIRLITETENQMSRGVNIPFDILLPHIRGKYIASCEGDDKWIDEYKLQIQTDFFESHPDYVFCCHNGLRHNCVTDSITRVDPFPSSCELNEDHLFFCYKNNPPTASFMIRTEAVRDFPDELAHAPVFDDVIRLYCMTKGRCWYDQRVMCYREYLHENSWNMRMRESREMNESYVNGMIQFYDRFDVYTEFKYREYICEVKNRLLRMLKLIYKNNASISIILPVYNEESFIKRTLDALINQTYPYYEVIIIDDKSEDGTCNIIQETVGEDPRFCIIHNDINLGAPKSRNRGLTLAGAKYILFIDADDDYETDFLEKLYITAIDTNSDVVTCKSNIVNMATKDVKIFGQWRRIEHLIGDEKLLEIDKPIGYRGICSLVDLAAWNKLIRRQFLVDTDIKFQEIDSYNDLSFSLLSCLLAAKLTFLNERLITYYQYHASGITDKRIKGYCPIVPAYDVVIEHNDIKNSIIREELINRAIHNAIAVSLMEVRSEKGREQILNELVSKIDNGWLLTESGDDIVIDPVCRFSLEFIRSHDIEDISISNIEQYTFQKIMEHDGTSNICIVPERDNQKVLNEILRISGAKSIFLLQDGSNSNDMKTYKLKEIWI